jgi:hypothetical protein
MYKKTPQLRVLLGYCLKQVKFVVFGVFLFSLLAASVITLLRPQVTQAASNNYLNFQGRLQTAGGAIVPDGYYNIRFRLYDVSSSGSALWTETWYDSNGATAGNDNRIEVKNGYFTTSLGSQTAFSSNINWDQQLWMTMQVGGSAQSSSPSYDTEMNPRLKVTGVPYAFRAGELAKYNASTGYTGLLQFQNTTGGNQTFVIPDQGAAGTYTLMTQESLSSLGILNGTSVQTNANIAIQSANDASATMVLKNRATQSADILQITDNSNNVLLNVDTYGTLNANGKAYIGGVLGVGMASSTGEQLRVKSADTDTVGLSIYGWGGASQNADLIKVDGPGTRALNYSGNGTLYVTAGSDQSNDLLQLQDSGSNVVARFTASGSLQTSSLDRATAGTLTLGGSTATGVSIGNGTSSTITLQSGNGNINLNSTDGSVVVDRTTYDPLITTPWTSASNSKNLTLATGSVTGGSALRSGNLTLGSGDGTGTNTSTGNVVIDSGAPSGSGTAGTVSIGNTNARTLNIANSAVTHTLQIATGAAVQTVTMGSTNGASALTLQAGSSGMTLTSTDGMSIRWATSAIFKPTADTTTAFQIQPSGSTTPIFNVDTQNGRIGIGKNNPAYKLDVVGDINLSTGSQFRINGTDICDSAGCAPASGSNSYIQANTNSMISGQNGNLYITSNGNYATARFQQKLFGTGDIIQAANGVGMINMSVDYHGAAFFKPTDSGTATFQIQDNGGVNMFTVDSTNSRVYVGNPTADSTGAVLVLDTKNTSGDPTGVNGAMYYNSNSGRFRCYEASAWRDCMSRTYTPNFIGYNQDSNSAVGVGQTPSATGTANYANLVSVTVTTPVTVSGIRATLGNYSGTAGNVDVGLYNNSGTRLASSGSVAAPGSGATSTVNFTSSVAIDPGIYWLAIASNQVGKTDGTGGPIFARYGIGGVGGNLSYASSFPLPSSVDLGSPSGAGTPFALMGIVSGGVTQ